ncbi:MAG: hypothetical protein IMF11_09055 [Proteobacteria bacterium]|nr:hypothetical protein [Pseudomonadota bacterium]
MSLRLSPTLIEQIGTEAFAISDGYLPTFAAHVKQGTGLSPSIILPTLMLAVGTGTSALILAYLKTAANSPDGVGTDPANLLPT